MIFTKQRHLCSLVGEQIKIQNSIKVNIKFKRPCLPKHCWFCCTIGAPNGENKIKLVMKQFSLRTLLVNFTNNCKEMASNTSILQLWKIFFCRFLSKSSYFSTTTLHRTLHYEELWHQSPYTVNIRLGHWWNIYDVMTRNTLHLFLWNIMFHSELPALNCSEK